jgi:hypothetical protein
MQNAKCKLGSWSDYGFGRLVVQSLKRQRTVGAARLGGALIAGICSGRIARER